MGSEGIGDQVAKAETEAGAGYLAGLEVGGGRVEVFTAEELPGLRTPMLVVDGQQHLMEHWLMRPGRASGMVKLGDPTSLVAYVKRHAPLNEVVVLADPGQFRVVAVLNHHAAIQDPGDETPASYEDVEPGWRDWLAELRYEPSPELRAWQRAVEKGLSQEEFLDLLEDWAESVAEPALAEVIDPIRTFEDVEFRTFRSTVDMKTGKGLLHVERADGGKYTKQVPNELVVLVTPFRGGTVMQKVTLRIRYRVEGKAIRFQLRPDRDLDLYLQESFLEEVETIREAGLFVVNGVPAWS